MFESDLIFFKIRAQFILIRANFVHFLRHFSSFLHHSLEMFQLIFFKQSNGTACFPGSGGTTHAMDVRLEGDGKKKLTLAYLTHAGYVFQGGELKTF